MSDLISRQAAIDELNKLDVSDGVGISSIACGVQESAIIAIQHLPSVQPQPEEDCDTCKHGYFGDRQCDNCRVRYPSHYEREEEHHGSD